MAAHVAGLRFLFWGPMGTRHEGQAFLDDEDDLTVVMDEPNIPQYWRSRVFERLELELIYKADESFMRPVPVADKPYTGMCI